MKDHLERQQSPLPGTGTVFVMHSRDGSWWTASWQSNDGEPLAIISTDDVSRDDAIAWARAQPAGRRLIKEVAAPDFAPLD
jgi:hypothetical protein